MLRKALLFNLGLVVLNYVVRTLPSIVPNLQTKQPRLFNQDIDSKITRPRIGCCMDNLKRHSTKWKDKYISEDLIPVLGYIYFNNSKDWQQGSQGIDFTNFPNNTRISNCYLYNSTVINNDLLLKLIDESKILTRALSEENVKKFMNSARKWYLSNGFLLSFISNYTIVFNDGEKNSCDIYFNCTEPVSSDPPVKLIFYNISPNHTEIHALQQYNSSQLDHISFYNDSEIYGYKKVKGKTCSSIVSQELGLKCGKTFRLCHSKLNRVLKAGIFSLAKIEVESHACGSVQLVLSVVESSSISFSPGLSKKLSDRKGVVGELNVVDKNFLGTGKIAKLVFFRNVLGSESIFGYSGDLISDVFSCVDKDRVLTIHISNYSKSVQYKNTNNYLNTLKLGCEFIYSKVFKNLFQVETGFIYDLSKYPRVLAKNASLSVSKKLDEIIEPQFISSGIIDQITKLHFLINFPLQSSSKKNWIFTVEASTGFNNIASSKVTDSETNIQYGNTGHTSQNLSGINPKPFSYLGTNGLNKWKTNFFFNSVGNLKRTWIFGNLKNSHDSGYALNFWFPIKSCMRLFGLDNSLITTSNSLGFDAATQPCSHEESNYSSNPLKNHWNRFMLNSGCTKEICDDTRSFTKILLTSYNQILIPLKKTRIINKFPSIYFSLSINGGVGINHDPRDNAILHLGNLSKIEESSIIQVTNLGIGLRISHFMLTYQIPVVGQSKSGFRLYLSDLD